MADRRGRCLTHVIRRGHTVLSAHAARRALALTFSTAPQKSRPRTSRTEAALFGQGLGYGPEGTGGGWGSSQGCQPAWHAVEEGAVLEHPRQGWGGDRAPQLCTGATGEMEV